MSKQLFLLLILVLGLLQPTWSLAEDRFPKPEFETAYQIPTAQHPLPRHTVFQFLDLAVLILALAVAAFFALRKRSRWGLFGLTLFAILYFGFYRDGCICPVGSLQNVFLSLSSDYIIPWVVLLFFALPLLAALFFGRVFCASVCPLGAIQEVVIFKPVKLPLTVKHILGLFPYLYLGLAILFTVTGSGFIVCQFDPFVGFYRLTASISMLILGLSFLALGVFVARPYCRFICPYGVLLGIFSFFSKNHLRITPRDCVQCRLCENACPVDAIHVPSPKFYKSSRQQQIKRIGILLACAPILMTALGWGFSQLTDVLARQNRMVALAERIQLEETGLIAQSNLDSDAFRQQQTQLASLMSQAVTIRKQFHIGLWLLGILMGLVITLKITLLLQRPHREDFEPDRFHCISCGRCMEYCPIQSEESVKPT